MFPKIGGKPPKWMVKIMEKPIKMDDFGIFGNTQMINTLVSPGTWDVIVQLSMLFQYGLWR